MPEGHSIHRLARAFEKLKQLGPCLASSPQGRFSEGAAHLNGSQLIRAFAHGKHLFMKFKVSEPATLHIHLGLYGSWTFETVHRELLPTHIGAPRVRNEHLSDKIRKYAGEDFAAPSPNTRLRLVFPGACADLTGPNQCELLTDEEVAVRLGKLGPDPLREESQAVHFVANSRRIARPIAQALMDQSVVAGVGNIYRCESLFIQRINPHIAAKNMSEKRLLALWEEISFMLREGVSDGRIVTAPGKPTRNWVYQRTGEPCYVCDTPIREEVLAGRRNFWCPNCQRH